MLLPEEACHQIRGTKIAMIFQTQCQFGSIESWKANYGTLVLKMKISRRSAKQKALELMRKLVFLNQKAILSISFNSLVG